MLSNLTPTSFTTTTTTPTSNITTTGTPGSPDLPRWTSPSRQAGEPAPLPTSPARSTSLLQLPQELIFKVLTDLPVRFSFSHPLRAFAATAHQPSWLVGQFLESQLGRPYLTSFKAGPMQEWIRCAGKLVNDALSLRQAFVDSARQISAGADPLATAGCCGIGVDFKLAAPTIPVQAQLFELRDTPVKLMAGGIGRERFLNEVLPVLAGLDDSCPVVLDASHNGLDSEALSALGLRIRSRRHVYSIDLSHNPLVQGEGVCEPLAQLLRTSPLTHLLLTDTRCNDATALAMAGLLEKHRFLRQLDLRDNGIGMNGTLALVKAAQQRRQAVPKGGLRALRLQGNPASRSCVAALANARYTLKRFGVGPGQQTPTQWRGYALLGGCQDLLKAIDSFNGRGKLRALQVTPLVTIGAPDDGEEAAVKNLEARTL